eukprot:s312_g8.t1
MLDTCLILLDNMSAPEHLMDRGQVWQVPVIDSADNQSLADIMSCGEGVSVSAPVNDVDLQNHRIQDIASEVLRLRLVHSQYKQLEGQLKAAVDKLQQTSDKVFQFSQYLEQGLRPGGSIGTLGGSFSGVEVENLLGLMECLCVVCNAPVVSKKQEDLLAATKWLLQDADALIRRLSELPPAPSMQSRRLAPYLLSCDSSWRGQLNEAGQCYEALRSWLSCYYQFSLVSSQMEANAAQLQRQEQLLSELSKEEGGEPGSLSAPTKPFAFRPCGLKRSSSVQSTSSAGSRRSQSPADRVARMANGIKVGGAVPVTRRASREIREASIKSPVGRLSDRSRAEEMAASMTVKSATRVAQGHEMFGSLHLTLMSLGNTQTIFAAYLPDVTEFKKLPVVYWLSGLTCTDENFSQKAGAFQAACDNQVVLVMPDTSPRGDGVPDEESGRSSHALAFGFSHQETHDCSEANVQDPHTYDFGIGAGFYLNATTDKYKTHYNMYDFVVKELPALVEANLPVTDKRAISGHSMGGHGALTIGLKNPERYSSVSAFAPICNPTKVPWGQKAFKFYLGSDEQSWKQYDATELISEYKGQRGEWV